MSKAQGRQPHHVKTINLALQGGGSHGAFTWGVLDRIFEDGRIWIEAISGASAGAMNAVVAAQGMYDGGGDGARAALEDFWRRTAEAAVFSPYRRPPWAKAAGKWSLESSPSYLALDLLGRVASPYDLNPWDLNPLRDLVGAMVDFDKVRGCGDMPLYISATNVETGHPRVFTREEISLDVVMASACLPFMFQAVEIDGKPYWDGGYMGNPVLYPFVYDSPADDIVIVQINPVVRRGVPKGAREILDRVNEITFNASLIHELRAIRFVSRKVAEGALPGYRRMNVHMIEARKKLRPMGASSKLNAEWAFLTHLRDIGREAAERFLARHFDDIGERTTLPLDEIIDGPDRPRPAA